MRFHDKVSQLLLGCLCATVVASVSFAQSGGTGRSFEGMLEFKLQTFDRVQYFHFHVKAAKIRVESAERDETTPIIIVDHDFRKSFYILPHREQYAELGDFQDPSVQPLESENGRGVEKTGETGEIEGFTCDQLLVKTEQGNLEIWATRGIGTAGTFYTTASEPQQNLAAWENLILSEGYFPLLTIAKDVDGDESWRLELTSVTRKTLSESLFRISSDYEKIGIDQLRPKARPRTDRRR